MTDDQARFVEELGQYLGSFGMTPMAGRMWGWLLICVPSEQTAAEIAEALQASRGAISVTGRLLETAGMIRRTRRRGDRREYFSSPPGAFRALLMGADSTYRRFREITEHGLEAIADLPPPARERLEEVHDFVQFVEGRLPAMLADFDRERRRLLAGSSSQSSAEQLDSVTA